MGAANRLPSLAQSGSKSPLSLALRKRIIDLKVAGLGVVEIVPFIKDEIPNRTEKQIFSAVNNAISKDFDRWWGALHDAFGDTDPFYAKDSVSRTQSGRVVWEAPVNMSDYAIKGRSASRTPGSPEYWKHIEDSRNNPKNFDRLFKKQAKVSFSEAVQMLPEEDIRKYWAAVDNRDVYQESLIRGRLQTKAAKIIAETAAFRAFSKKIGLKDLWKDPTIREAYKNLTGGYSGTLKDRIVNFKARELSAIDPDTNQRKILPRHTKAANKWWSGLLEGQRLTEQKKWARRDFVFYRNIQELLNMNDITGDDANNFLRTFPHKHHFDQLIAGSTDIDKYFSSEFMPRDLHNHIHNTGVADRLSRHLNKAGIVGYNVTRGGQFPPWFTRVVNKFYRDPEISNRVLSDMMYVATGRPISDHQSYAHFISPLDVESQRRGTGILSEKGHVQDPEYGKGKLLQSMRKVTDNVPIWLKALKVLGGATTGLSIPLSVAEANRYKEEGKHLREDLTKVGMAAPIVGIIPPIIDAAEWAYKQPTVFPGDPYSGMGTQQGILGEGHPGFQDRVRSKPSPIAEENAESVSYDWLEIPKSRQERKMVDPTWRGTGLQEETIGDKITILDRLPEFWNRKRESIWT